MRPSGSPPLSPSPHGPTSANLARIRRVPEERVGEWAERLGFGGLLDTRLPDLSKGSAHKAGLIQALLASPELLVLGAGPGQIRQGALNAFADLATLVFPICAWAARGLLDTEPPAQPRHRRSISSAR